MDTFRGEVCGVDNCRSREYHIENGLTYCRRGHLQEGFIEHDQDFEDLNPAASQTTRIRSSQQQQEQDKRELRELAGPRGLKLYRLAFEHLLQHQLKTLIDEKGLPEDLEIVAQELWAMRVHIAHEAGLDLDSNDSSRSSTRPLDNDDGQLDSGVSEEAQNILQSRRLPSYLDSFAICYLAAIILRVPMSVAKLQHWIETDQLPYITATKLIPTEMRRKFEPWFYNAFAPSTALKSSGLRPHISALSIMLCRRYKSLRVPTLNWRPLLIDYIFCLGLPLNIYPFLDSIIRVLGVSLSLPSVDGKRTDRYNARFPDVQLMAWLVFAVKFHYPFDIKEHFAADVSDLTYLTLNWHEWEKDQNSIESERRNSSLPIAPGSELTISPDHVSALQAPQLDAYLDWFAQTWLEDRPSTVKTPKGARQVSQGMLQMFPLAPQQAADELISKARELDTRLELQLLQDTYAHLQPMRIVSEQRAQILQKKVRRVGSRYVKYDRDADLKAEHHAELFHEKAANIIKVPRSTLLSAIWMVEQFLEASEDRIALFLQEYGKKGARTHGDDIDQTEQDLPQTPEDG